MLICQIFFNVLYRKDSLVKPQFIGELTYPAGDSEDDFSSSSGEEFEEEEDELASSDEPIDAIESGKSSSWCVIV